MSKFSGQIVGGPPTACPSCKTMFNSDIVHSRRRNSDGSLCPPCRKKEKQARAQRKANKQT